MKGVSMFTKEKTDAASEAILAELQSLSRQVAEMRGERESVREELDLSTEIVRLKRELTSLEIDKDRKTEEHQREKREVTHMVGLERKRQEFEVDSAKRDTQLTIREENLSADRERFEKEMAFTRRRFEEEVGYLKELMSEVLERLPTTKALITVGAPGNGNGKDNDADEE
jgi:hypothetical protein